MLRHTVFFIKRNLKNALQIRSKRLHNSWMDKTKDNFYISRDYTIDNPSNRCFGVLKNAVVKSDQSSVVGFPDFLEENWQKMVVCHSELSVLHWYSSSIVTCPHFIKKTVNHLLGLLRMRSLLFDLAHLEIPIQSNVLYLEAHARKWFPNNNSFWKTFTEFVLE